MARKNLFEIIDDNIDISTELNRMYRLVENHVLIASYHRYFSLREFVAKKGFDTWKNRGRCINLNDFLSLLEYEKLWETAQNDIRDLLLLIEIIYNIWYIAKCTLDASDEFKEVDHEFRLLKTIMDDCLAHYNYKGIYFRDSEQLIVIEDKPETTAVVEIVEDNISRKVLRYNHYMLRGDLQAKRDILLAIGTELEPKRELLKAIDKNLDDIFYILNNLHLRHNNKAEGNKHFKHAVTEMDDSTLEYWYDELYQMMLLAYLQLDQQERNSKIKALKSTVNLQ